MHTVRRSSVTVWRPLVAPQTSRQDGPHELLTESSRRDVFTGTMPPRRPLIRIEKGPNNTLSLAKVAAELSKKSKPKHFSAFSFQAFSTSFFEEVMAQDGVGRSKAGRHEGAPVCAEAQRAGQPADTKCSNIGSAEASGAAPCIGGVPCNRAPRRPVLRLARRRRSDQGPRRDVPQLAIA